MEKMSTLCRSQMREGEDVMAIKTKLYDVISVCQTSSTVTQELFSSRQRRQKLVKTIFIYMKRWICSFL